MQFVVLQGRQLRLLQLLQRKSQTTGESLTIMEATKENSIIACIGQSFGSDSSNSLVTIKSIWWERLYFHSMVSIRYEGKHQNILHVTEKLWLQGFMHRRILKWYKLYFWWFGRKILWLLIKTRNIKHINRQPINTCSNHSFFHSTYHSPIYYTVYKHIWVVRNWPQAKSTQCIAHD